MKGAFDIIVVGGGGSGLAAAVSASEHGCRVLLMEKCESIGGTTGIAIGAFTAAETRHQKQAGIVDSAREHAEDAALFAPAEIEKRNNDPLRAFLIDQASETLQWLVDMGLVFHGPNPEPPNRVPRMHNVVPGAKAYIATLQSKLIRLGGTVWTKAVVSKLVARNGRIVGVEARVDGEPKSVSADRGVILAAGDYANSPELISRFKGAQFANINGINPHATGDGHRMAEEVGAQLANMDITYGPEIRLVPPPSPSFQQLLPANRIAAGLVARALPFIPKILVNRATKRLLVTWQHPENSLFDDGAILVNNHGLRFCDECRTPEREIAVAAQTRKTAYILLDEALIARYSQWPHFISTAPEIAYAYVADYLRLRPDVTCSAETLIGVADARGIPAERLAQTVNEYNASKPSGRAALKGSRWCLLGPAKAYFTTTEGGVTIDGQFAVVDTFGKPIPGLYAVGQTGLSGQILWGHGLHIAWAMTSGRLAGKMLAEKNVDR